MVSAAEVAAAEVVADSSEIGGRVLSFFFPLSTSRDDALVGVLSVARFFVIIYTRYYGLDIMDMEVWRYVLCVFNSAG